MYYYPHLVSELGTCLVRRPTAAERFLASFTVGFEVEGHVEDDDLPSYDPCYGCDCEDCDGCEAAGQEPDAEDRLSHLHDLVAAELHCGHGKGCVGGGKTVWYVYEDGSVSTEVVTAPLRLGAVRSTLERVFSCLRQHNVDVAPNCKADEPTDGVSGAGGHQTYSFDGRFSLLAVQNLMRLVRKYYPALLAVSTVKGSYVRDGDTHFRGFLSARTVDAPLERNKKYNCVNLKEIKRCMFHNQYVPRVPAVDSCRLIELRWPDSHRNVNQVLFSSVLNAALIAEALRLDEEDEVEETTDGEIRFSRVELADFYEYDEWTDSKQEEIQLRGLVNRLRPHLEILATWESIQACVSYLEADDMRMNNDHDMPRLVLLDLQPLRDALAAVQASSVECE